MKRLIDPLKFTVSFAMTLVTVVLTAVMVKLGSTAGTLVFGLLFLVYALVLYFNCAALAADSKGITMKRLLQKEKHWSWDQVRELGVIGTKVVKGKYAKKTGTKYLYFSEKKLSSEERFRLGLNWPPKDKMFIRFNEDFLKYVRKFCKQPVVLYNTGKLVVSPPFEEDVEE